MHAHIHTYIQACTHAYTHGVWAGDFFCVPQMAFGPADFFFVYPKWRLGWPLFFVYLKWPAGEIKTSKNWHASILSHDLLFSESLQNFEELASSYFKSRFTTILNGGENPRLGGPRRPFLRYARGGREWVWVWVWVGEKNI